MSFGGIFLPKSDTQTLEDCGVYSDVTITFLYQVSGGASGQKHYSQGRTISGNIKMTNEACLITLDDAEPTMEMPCGHTIAPVSLADYIDVQVKSQKTELKCPACHKIWKLCQIKDMGLRDDEKRLMEVGLTENLAFSQYDCNKCPQCGCMIEKIDGGLRVKCYMCPDFEFCWRCLGKWVAPGRGCEDCGNHGCVPLDSKILQMLLTCGTTKMDYCNVVVPTIRACPECGTVIQHRTSACKRYTCPMCNLQFCFVCLGIYNKRAGIWPCGSYNTPCKVAHRQTVLPSKQ